MKEEKKSFWEWVKQHKKQLIIAGISITALIALVVGIHNRESLINLWNELKLRIDKPEEVLKGSEPNKIEVKPVCEAVTEAVTEECHESVKRAPHDVSKHVRNLSEGRHASAEKVATAADNGIDLLDGQTWVVGYSTGKNAA